MASAEETNFSRGALRAEQALALSSITHSFDAENVVEAVDLSVSADDVVSLVGPSGCGKSTILRIAAGLLLPDGGAVSTSGDTTGVVMQDPQLLPWRTALENVALPGELAGHSRAQRFKRAQDLLDLVGLEEAAGLFPSQLSGGMRMRVAVARALALEPKLLLLDEPFGALDDMTRQALNNQLLEIQRTSNIAVLFITHSISEAVFLSSTVAVMASQPGRIHARIEVPFAERVPELRFESSFNQLCAQVSAALAEATHAGEGTA